MYLVINVFRSCFQSRDLDVITSFSIPKFCRCLPKNNISGSILPNSGFKVPKSPKNEFFGMFNFRVMYFGIINYEIGTL